VITTKDDGVKIINSIIVLSIVAIMAIVAIVAVIGVILIKDNRLIF
jgi:hypothetical protein